MADGVKRVAVLGSTGSIGVSALNVIGRHRDRFAVRSLAASTSGEALAEQVRAWSPARAVLADESAPRAAVEAAVHEVGTAAGWGRDALLGLCDDDDVDVVINAVVGAAGLELTLRALRAGKRVALANKESLVAAGPLVLAARDSGGGVLVPVDSEHSAILQCLQGSRTSEVQRLVLTASGGPFRGWTTEQVAAAGPSDALNHPTWEMGAKITVDSATLANKALEVIEAHVLYGVPYDRIDVVVHPQSIIHSFVEFADGSVLAQLGFPTMELPILYALTYPERIQDESLITYDPVRSSPLTFETVDHDAFPLLGIGIGAGRAGGTAPAVFNAANEVAVRGFLEGGLTLGDMMDVVRTVTRQIPPRPLTDLATVREADAEARAAAEKQLAAIGVRGRSDTIPAG